MVSTDLKCSTREAHDCPIFWFSHRGHVHVTAAGCVNDVNDLGLSLGCDLQANEWREKEHHIDSKEWERFALASGALPVLLADTHWQNRQYF